MIERVKLFMYLFGFLPGIVWSQTGSIAGKIYDAKTNETLIGATVVINETTKGTITDFDGNFSLENVNPGTYNLLISYVSYKTLEVKSIAVTSGQATNLNIKMEPATTALEEVQVVTKANREAETMLLIDRKTASVGIENIGAQELAKKGVSNAADAATKVTGITKQEGSSSLNVRGLGDRYNTTTLNSLPLPSNNSKLKNINLGLFNSDIISHISIEKSYSPWLYGDFGGANIDINTKKYVGKEFFSVQLGQGFNSTLLNNENFYTIDGPSKIGFQNLEFPNIDLLNDKIKYDFSNSWNPISTSTKPNTNISLSAGKSINLKNNSSLNSFLTLSFDNWSVKSS
ncbi:MAG: carboxypeptidase-like regulatory domain-containing protein [Bacteroidales bacterium]|nr:carboxypeptidase-like regulatory domain-containing protein [Bacteroidales bacterium]MBN2820058.1 carboxypeptidase-like regulatory domain-containing protein [Bacteroidales bacterium]